MISCRTGWDRSVRASQTDERQRGRHDPPRASPRRFGPTPSRVRVVRGGHERVHRRRRQRCHPCRSCAWIRADVQSSSPHGTGGPRIRSAGRLQVGGRPVTGPTVSSTRHRLGGPSRHRRAWQRDDACGGRRAGEARLSPDRSRDAASPSAQAPLRWPDGARARSRAARRSADSRRQTPAPAHAERQPRSASVRSDGTAAGSAPRAPVAQAVRSRSTYGACGRSVTLSNLARRKLRPLVPHRLWGSCRRAARGLANPRTMMQPAPS